MKKYRIANKLPIEKERISQLPHANNPQTKSTELKSIISSSLTKRIFPFSTTTKNFHFSVRTKHCAFDGISTSRFLIIFQYVFFCSRDTPEYREKAVVIYDP